MSYFWLAKFRFHKVSRYSAPLTASVAMPIQRRNLDLIRISLKIRSFFRTSVG